MTGLIILAINILGLCFLKSGKKYWLVPIPLWIILVSGFIGWRIFSDRQLQIQENEYWQTTENKGYGDHAKLIKLRASQKSAQKQNRVLINCIGLQTFITFILQIAGQKRTTQKTYKWTALIFGILFGLVLILFMLMAVVPTSGYI